MGCFHDRLSDQLDFAERRRASRLLAVFDFDREQIREGKMSEDLINALQKEQREDQEEITRLRDENERLREEINAAYDKGRGSRGEVVAAGHALFVYAQKVAHKIKHHSLEKLLPLPNDECLAFIKAVDESSKSERARAAIREGGKDDAP